MRRYKFLSEGYFLLSYLFLCHSISLHKYLYFYLTKECVCFCYLCSLLYSPGITVFQELLINDALINLLLIHSLVAPKLRPVLRTLIK